MATDPSPVVDALKNIASGCVGGFAQVAVGHPLDTIKVRLQTQVAGAEAYAGVVDCFKAIVKEEGMRGLYAGAASPLLGAAAHNAGLFLLNGMAKSFLLAGRPAGPNGEDPELTTADQFKAGAVAGLGISVVETPIDLFKVKMQAQRGADPSKVLYSGVIDAAKKISKSHGIRGWYQGVASTTMRNVPAFSGYFGTFNYVMGAMTPDGASQPPIFAAFIAGGAAGAAFWAPFYPVEMVKTIMQSQPLEMEARQYKTTLAAFRGILATEGMAGFYKGYSAAILRAVPVNASIFAGFTFAKRLMGDTSEGH